ncbi:MAG: carbon-nitrogen hydrolase family protein [Chloroflexi bacterium]|nr:carbon-nitrogen hydrolase family protein [Chloroflexota bacterium]
MALHRIAVGELVPELLPGSDAWRTLVAELERTRPDLLVLNELPFGSWLAAREQFDGAAWEESIEAHAAGLAALPELGVPVVVGTRPVDLEGRRCNQAFVSQLDAEPHFPHTKQHIPNSPGYRETTWTSPGATCFEVVEVGRLRIGILICTDIMFTEHAREYGRSAVDLIVVPRATPPGASHTFDVALQMTAIVSGCWVASSNRGGQDSAGEPFEGRGCLIDPLGNTVARTSSRQWLVVHEIDTDFADWKKTVYPCNVS